MKIKDMTLKSKMILALGIPVGLLIILAFTSYKSIVGLLETNALVDKSNKVIQHAMDLRKLMVSVQNHQRGYLIAGKEEFLNPYHEEKRKFFKKIGSSF